MINTQLGSNNTLCGGGRYSSLIHRLGGPDLPGVGCAIGIERLLMLNDMNYTNNNERFYVITEGIEAQKKALHLIQILQLEKIKFNIEFENTSFQKQIRKAIKEKALGCLILGPDEIKNHTITIKWIEKRSQITINYKSTIKYIKAEMKL